MTWSVWQGLDSQQICVILTGGVNAKAGGTRGHVHLRHSRASLVGAWGRMESTRRLSPHEKMLQAKILSMNNLPTLGASTMRVVKLLKEPTVNIPAVLEALSRDPALCTSMLKIVNSALYSPKTPVENIERAVVTLGMKKVFEVVVSSSLMNIMTGQEKQLWLHSFSTAMLVRSLVEGNQLQVSADLEMCALIHDIGRIVVMSYSKVNEAAIQEKIREDLMPVHLAEVEILSVSHDVIGGWLLEAWRMDESLVVPMSTHHQAVVPEKYVLEAALLSVADYVDTRAREWPCRRPYAALLNAAGLGEVAVEDFISYQAQEIQKLDAAAGL